MNLLTTPFSWLRGPGSSSAAAASANGNNNTIHKQSDGQSGGGQGQQRLAGTATVMGEATHCQLFRLLDQGWNLIAQDVHAKVLSVPPAQFIYDFQLLQHGTNNEFTRQRINASMQVQTFASHNTLQWVLLMPLDGEGRAFQVLRLVCRNHEDFVNLSHALAVALYEGGTCVNFDKGVADDQAEYVFAGHDLDVDMMSDGSKEDQKKALLDEQEEGFQTDNESVGAGAGFATLPPGKAHAECNTALDVGTAENRTYVTRGTRIGVFKHLQAATAQDENDDYDPANVEAAPNLTFLSKIPIVNEHHAFEPTFTLLHDRDENLLLLDRDKPHSIFNMDLSRQQIVSEYKPGQGCMEVLGLAPSNKFGQRTGSQEVVGFNANGVMRFDFRMKDPLAQQNLYRSKMRFTAMCTTVSGDIAVANASGDIRLYDKIDKRAKSLLPGLGEPVTHLDVTKDGSYILATTPRYLLVVSTSGKKGTDQDQPGYGFHKSINKTTSPPIKLQLSHEDMFWYNIDKIDFTAATFNVGVGAGAQETWIVTSTGPFVITWNFNRVRRRQLGPGCYKIKKCEDKVVANQFVFNRDNRVVVATKHDVFMEKRGKKKQSTRTVGGRPGAAASAPVRRVPKEY